MPNLLMMPDPAISVHILLLLGFSASSALGRFLYLSLAIHPPHTPCQAKAGFYHWIFCSPGGYVETYSGLKFGPPILHAQARDALI